MAINPSTQYAGQITPATAEYPYGSARDVSSPGAGDGTPVQQAWVNDSWGFLQKILSAGGVTPSGSPDSVISSDYFTALTNVFSKIASPTFTGVPSAPTATTGTSTTQIATTAFVTNAVSVNTGTANLSTSGYVRLPLVISGSVVQFFLMWGQASYLSSDGATGTLNSFPMAFPNGCLRMTGADTGSGTNNFGLSPISATQFRHWGKINNAYANTTTHYFAVGY